MIEVRGLVRGKSYRECAVCGRRFLARRRDARYCGAHCRVKASRSRRKTGDFSVTPVSVTNSGEKTGQKMGKSPSMGVYPSVDLTQRKANGTKTVKIVLSLEVVEAINRALYQGRGTTVAGYIKDSITRRLIKEGLL
jgi:hypothetical protein